MKYHVFDQQMLTHVFVTFRAIEIKYNLQYHLIYCKFIRVAKFYSSIQFNVFDCLEFVHKIHMKLNNNKIKA